MIALGAEHLESWQANRYAVLRGALDSADQRDMRAWVDELAAWSEVPDRWMKYFEGDARQLCRVENFVPYHEALRHLLGRDDLHATLEALFGEPPILFKEKINYKLPGGQGFEAHQDAPAFALFGQRYHITVMMAADATTEANGCLEVVEGHAERKLLAQGPGGTLAREEEQRLAWRPIPTEPGDVLLFDSYVPHRSGPNRTSAPRRALYVTYNGLSEGDRRAEYYARKRRAFPPECERPAGAAPSAESAMFNLGNPIR